jgi:hypothetical protein
LAVNGILSVRVVTLVTPELSALVTALLVAGPNQQCPTLFYPRACHLAACACPHFIVCAVFIQESVSSMLLGLSNAPSSGFGGGHVKFDSGVERPSPITSVLPGSHPTAFISTRADAPKRMRTATMYASGATASGSPSVLASQRDLDCDDDDDDDGSSGNRGKKVKLPDEAVKE